MVIPSVPFVARVTVLLQPRRMAWQRAGEFVLPVLRACSSLPLSYELLPPSAQRWRRHHLSCKCQVPVLAGQVVLRRRNNLNHFKQLFIAQRFASESAHVQ